MVTLINETFNCGVSFTVSEVQSIIIMAVCKADMVLKLRVLPLDSEARGSRLTVMPREAGAKETSRPAHRVTLPPPTRPHLLIVPLPLGGHFLPDHH